MTSPLIAGYVTGLHQSLPAAIADEAATGLIDTYQDHLDSGASDQEAAHAALGHLRCHDFDVSPEFAGRSPLGGGG
jgi:hypothetical protein